MVLRRRGSNGLNQPGRLELVPADHEMAAMEDLGPKTRYAIANAPLKILATSIVTQIIDVNDKIEVENETRERLGQPLRPYLDPKNPDLDARLANGVLSHNVELLHQDRPIEDAMAGVRPLVGKPSPKSIREQRKAMRGSRRW